MAKMNTLSEVEMSFKLKTMNPIFENKNRMIPSEFDNIFDRIGLFINIPALALNLPQVLFSVNTNKALSLFTLLLAIIWWLMKMYDQYLITKARKKEAENGKA